MNHRGEIVEKAIRESGYPIATLAKKLGRSRRHLYNIFENNKVPWDTIEDIGKIINHDFSKNFKELRLAQANVMLEEKQIYLSKERELEEARTALSDLRVRYIELLEKYNGLLSSQIPIKPKRKSR